VGTGCPERKEKEKVIMNNKTIVATRSGKIKGISENGLEIFKGVPYAESPINDLRFRPTIPKTSWNHILDCTQYGPISPQRVNTFLGPDIYWEQSEADCLTLNVWTPETDQQRRPVLFWIHGGGLSFGSGAWNDGSALARRGDVVVVTINYRVGILGYLYVKNEIANLGQFDQITALKWVRDNIEAFGGNPDNVTIFGESAGGVAVCALMAMPGAKGLFHRVISQSGVCHPLSHRPPPEKNLDIMLSELGLKEFSFKALQKLPTQKIVEAATKLELEARQKGRNFPYGIFVDEKTLPEHPLKAVREGFAKDISLIAGTNQDEAKLYTAMRPPEKGFDETALLKSVHRIMRALGRDEDQAKKVIKMYVRARDGKLPIDPLSILDAFMTDFRFRIPALRLAEAQSQYQTNVFSYLFNYQSPAMGGALGACHALEIPFVFGSLGEKQRKIYPQRSPETDVLSGKMMEAWTAFARTGNPTHQQIPRWVPYDLKKRGNMIFGSEVILGEDPFGQERKIWEGLF
jgi:para-nitrobenzyl esterase